MRGAVRTAVLALALVAGCGSGDPGEQGTPTSTATPTATQAPSPKPTPTPTPTSTPTPTRQPADIPPADELTISTSGVGPLEVGVPPRSNPGAAMIEWDPDHCAEIVGDDDPGRWVVTAYDHTDDTDYTGGPTQPLHVGADEESIYRIDVMGTGPSTAEGIGIGATVEQLQEVYPQLQGPFEGAVSRVWWVEGQDGTMVFETQGAESGLRPEGTPQSVILIRVLEPGYAPQFATANSDDVAGGCL